MSGVISSLDDRRGFLCFCAFCGHTQKNIPLPFFANASAKNGFEDAENNRHNLRMECVE